MKNMKNIILWQYIAKNLIHNLFVESGENSGKNKSEQHFIVYTLHEMDTCGKAEAQGQLRSTDWSSSHLSLCVTPLVKQWFWLIAIGSDDILWI